MAEGTYTVTVELQYPGDNDLDTNEQLQSALGLVNALLAYNIQLPPNISHDQPTHGDPTFEAD